MAQPRLLLQGTAFITGAGSGIGQATAIAFAQNGVKKFGLADIRADNLNETVRQLTKMDKSIEIEPLELDVADEQGVISAMAKLAQRFGRVDYAINNAGIGGPLRPSAEVDVEGWKRCLDVNTTGVFICSREAIRQMLKQSDNGDRLGRGVIVNVASMLGLIGTAPSVPSPAYVASKHAVVGLTKADAIIYSKRGIRINAICPGYVATPLLLSTTTAGGVMDREVEKTPIARLAKMEEIADSIVFLASPMSSYMCGAAMVVDGGYTVQ